MTFVNRWVINGVASTSNRVTMIFIVPLTLAEYFAFSVPERDRPIAEDSTQQPISPNSKMTEFRTNLLQGISKLFNNKAYADLKLIIGDFEMPAHSLVLTAQSGYFEKALHEGLVESETKELRFTEGSMYAY
ncbi:hypothetical protein BX600DRAFT_139586 [Xylariales sp. PMI_506]|nr:hypothetical protein BX600DRAFT_139586 [Xylariales sp. PMI_506]